MDHIREAQPSDIDALMRLNIELHEFSRSPRVTTRRDREREVHG